jgi:transcriptional regulator GlxA family with amidase domain
MNAKIHNPNLSIAIIAFDGISPFHLSVPCMVFGEDRSSLGMPRFKVQICAVETGILHTAVGFDITVQHGLGILKKADIIIVPSWNMAGDAPPDKLLEALRRAHQRGARIVGLCLGAFVVAEAGLLNGKAATTHWHWAPQFAERYPQVQVDPAVLYVDNGDVVTSAGTAAGIDCCLYLLRQLCGAEVANRVARRMVVAPHRAGGQAQFIEHPIQASKSDENLSRVLTWATQRLAQQHSIDTLADRAAMSRRTFTRRFRNATGTTLTQWLLQQRISQAQRLLEATSKSIELIATEAGFGSAVSLRQHFSAMLSMSPSAYRKQYQQIE